MTHGFAFVGRVVRAIQGAAAVTACILAACSRSEPRDIDLRLDSLEHRVRSEQEKLVRVQGEIAEAEKRAERARVDAEYQSCRAVVKELRAETERRRGACAKDLADRTLCKARNSERAATGGVLGCFAGIATAAFTGGAAVPWALGGCGAGLGAGALAEDECPSAECATKIDSIEADVLAMRGLAATPRCGGYLGLETSTVIVTVGSGVVIDRVHAGTYADSATLASADVLTDLNGIPIRKGDDIDVALGRLREGESLTSSVVRRGEMFRFSALASRRLEGGGLASALRLGVDLRGEATNVSYRAGANVSLVATNSPAALAGMQVGDRVVRLAVPTDDGQLAGLREIHRASDVEAFMEDVPPNGLVAVTVGRSGVETQYLIRTALRADRTEL